jgi:hypothetical protein
MIIKKAKLKNRSLEVEYAEKKTFITPEAGDPVESSRDITSKCFDVCHDSLVAAFDQLKPHAVLIADLRDAVKVENAIAQGISLYEYDLEELSSVTISGFVVTGSEDDGSEAVMIIFQKKTASRTISITTPPVKFDDPEYVHCFELASVVQECISEVTDYLNGKVAVKQLEMNFDEGFNTDDIAVIEPKKRSKKVKFLAGIDVESVSHPENEENVA